MRSSNAAIEHGILVRQWKWPLRVLWWWFAIGLGVWVAVVTVHWLWTRDLSSPAERVAHANQLVVRELENLEALMPGFFDPVALAARINVAIHDTAIAAASGAARAVMNWPVFMRQNAASDTIRQDADPGGDFVRRQISEAGEAWQLLSVHTTLFSIRTSAFLSGLPLLALGLALGATDGLVARAKRKACAGHESASIYHRAKLGLSFVGIVGYLAYLLVPVATSPSRMLMPIALLMALLMRLQCAYYKKFL